LNFNNKVGVIVLAAGEGTRLNSGKPSPIPKVLYKICGRPMISYILNTLEKIGMENIVIVVGYKANLVKKTLGAKYTYVLQKKQQGTGDAPLYAKKLLASRVDTILILQGDDSAFYKPQTLLNLINLHNKEKATLTLLTINHPNPDELGRILRDRKGNIQRVAEKEVLTFKQKKIQEINTGCYCFNDKWLWQSLSKLKPSRTGDGEYILPDLVSIAVKEGKKVITYKIYDLKEWVGINTPKQLEYANKLMKKKLRSYKSVLSS
jgi:bifunctional UDP-N-acetylglucosamine pyrophosphorylase/glucosamine-1-phosphate N-acetyltransferase